MLAQDQLHIMQFFCISPGVYCTGIVNKNAHSLIESILSPAISLLVIGVHNGEVAWLAY